MVLDLIVSFIEQYWIPLGASLAVLLSARDVYRWVRGPLLEVQEIRIENYDGPPRPYLSVGVGATKDGGPPNRYWCEVDVANHGSRQARGTYLGLFQTHERDEEDKVVRKATMGYTDRRMFQVVPVGDTVTFRRIFHMEAVEESPVDAFFQVWAIPASGRAVGAEVHVRVDGDEITKRNVSLAYRSRFNMFLCRLFSRLPDEWRYKVLDRQARPFLDMLANQRRTVEEAKKTDFGIAAPRDD